MPYSNAQKKQHIKEIQTYLYAISMFNNKIPQIIPDGLYGKETATAVRAFQREYGLQENGNVNSATWNKIVGVYRAYQHSAPCAYNVFPSQAYVVKSGDDGELVYIIQAMLGELGMYYDNFPKTTVCGNYNAATVTAVKNFQKRVGLPQNGVVDCKTWNMLVGCCEHTSRTLQ